MSEKDGPKTAEAGAKPAAAVAASVAPAGNGSGGGGEAKASRPKGSKRVTKLFSAARKVKLMASTARQVNNTLDRAVDSWEEIIGKGSHDDFHRVLLFYRNQALSPEDTAVTSDLRKYLSFRKRYLFVPRSHSAAEKEQWKDVRFEMVDGVFRVYAKMTEEQKKRAQEKKGKQEEAEAKAKAKAADEGGSPGGSSRKGRRRAGGATNNRVVGGTQAEDEKNLTPKQISSWPRFARDLAMFWQFVKSGPAKTATHMRLQILSSSFELYNQLNTRVERKGTIKDQRDFYNICKVDNHIHLAACMTSKHLLKFIRRKLAEEPDTVVLPPKPGADKKKKGEGEEKKDEKKEEEKGGATEADGKASAGRKGGKQKNKKAKRQTGGITLAQLFKEQNMDGAAFTIDALGSWGNSAMFHRFDYFNSSYNPFGQSVFRDLFLKSKNHIQGRFFAELATEVFQKLETRDNNVIIEPRISVYGKSRSDWDETATWVERWKLYHPRVRWMVQVPRIFTVYKKYGSLDNFGQLMDNLFRPLFEVTADPASHPQLHEFLQHVVGFDSVDDESFPDGLAPSDLSITPEKWNTNDKPNYSFVCYHMYANLYVLNRFREMRGLNTFTFRPHCGEAGPLHHLATTFFLAEGINHGIKVAESPTLQYLYYCAQIGMSVSPLSNNTLFKSLDDNPFPLFARRGLNVSLSTDDPMQFHTTQEPLVEEYTIARTKWALSVTDLSEIARNSVLQSGLSHEDKTKILGAKYSQFTNDISFSNIPDCRVKFRREQYMNELRFLTMARDQALAEQAAAAGAKKKAGRVYHRWQDAC